MKEGTNMSLKKWKVIAPLGLAAAGALAAGISTLLKKPAEVSPAAAPSAGAAPSGPLVTGVYSFISGYQDAATVEFSLRFNPEAGSFSVVGEDFLSYSSASHVGIYEGEEFKAQIEYVPYYSGEDFDALVKGLKEKYRDVAPVSYAALSGVKYLDGDSMCLCFPIPGDKHSYVQLILFQVKKDEDHPLSAIAESPAVKTLLDTARLESKR